MTTVNFAEMLANANQVGEPIPDGAYDVVIASAEPRTASTGKAMIMVKCQVLTGPHASRSIVNNFVLSPDNPNAAGFFFRHMAVLGLSKDYFAAGPQIDQVCRDLVNRQAHITVGTKDGRQNVNNWEPLQGGQLSAVPTSQPAAFNAPAPSPMQNFAPAPQFNGQMATPPVPQPQVYQQPAVPGQQPYQQPPQQQFPQAQPAAPGYQQPPQQDPQFLQQFQQAPPQQPQYAQQAPAQQYPAQPQFAPLGAPDQQAAYAPTGEPYAQPAAAPQQYPQQAPAPQPAGAPAAQPPADPAAQGVPQPPLPPI